LEEGGDVVDDLLRVVNGQTLPAAGLEDGDRLKEEILIRPTRSLARGRGADAVGAGRGGVHGLA